MLWLIKLKLRKLSKRADPDARFRLALRKELLSSLPRRPWHAFIMRPVAVTTSLAAILGAGTASYAYASDDVLPDHTLYPVREQVERLVKTIAVTPKAQAAVQLAFVKRRVREMELMASRQRPLKRLQVEKFEREFGLAVAAGEKLKNGERSKFDETLSAAELAQIKILQNVRNRLREERAKQEVENLIKDETMRVAKKIDLLHEKRRQAFERQLKRREAIEQELPWKIEDDDVKILPVEPFEIVESDETVVSEVSSIEGPEPPSEASTMTRIPKPPMPRIAPPPERKPQLAQPTSQAPLRVKLRNLIERGGLRVLRRPEGGVQLVATTSTPPGIRLLLKDINQRLLREPWLVTEKE